MRLHVPSRAHWARALPPLAVGVLVLVVAGGPGGPATGSAANPYAAGQPAAARTVLRDAAAGRLRAAAAPGWALLGTKRVASTRVERITNRFTATTYDEVTDLDAGGRPIALQRFDRAGRLVAAVRFGLQATDRIAIDDPVGAASAAGRLARGLRLDPAGSPAVRRAGGGDWVVTWPRIVHGVPVRGDGVRVQVWADGSLHVAVRTERPLADEPPSRISATDAGRLVERHLDAWFGGSDRAGLRPGAPALAWVAPNDTFDHAVPDAPSPILRLAWVVEVRTSGTLAGGLRALELYIDAGDGRLLGGDVLR